jgi:DNA modification methylase
LAFEFPTGAPAGLPTHDESRRGAAPIAVSINWTGDRKQTTLWSISSKDQDADTVHGTQKPVECMRRPILNNSSPGQPVYEPFLGSGTTLIAAETCGRTCLAVELSPAYVDVAVRRWQAFTGKNATRQTDGVAFEDLAQSASEEGGS